MDCTKVGALIKALRIEKGLTQKQLADSLNISDKAISKWERGLGCPDVSLLAEVSDRLGVNIDKILLGDISISDKDGGNVKKSSFYLCPHCGNILTATSQAELSCCGRQLPPLIPKPCDDAHRPSISELEDEYYVTLDHDMTKQHYISFVALLSYDRLTMVKLYPEQACELRLPITRRGKLYICCAEHGLFTQEIK